MEIFSNWIFWVVLASIVFVLALIGYLTESMKKPKKEDKEEKNEEPVEPVLEEPKAEDVKPEPVVNEVKADDWMTMPEVNKPLEEVKVSSIQDAGVNEAPSASTENVSPVTPEVPETLNDVPSATVDTSNVADVPSATVDTSTVTENPVNPAPSDQNVTDASADKPAEEKNNDIWNL